MSQEQLSELIQYLRSREGKDNQIPSPLSGTKTNRTGKSPADEKPAGRGKRSKSR